MSVIIPLPDTAHEFHPDDMITKQSIGGQVLFVENNKSAFTVFFLLVSISRSAPEDLVQDRFFRFLQGFQVRGR
jgi:hypothetical protein